MASSDIPVDDIAEEADAAAQDKVSAETADASWFSAVSLQDREHLRQARALEARWRWESLLEDDPPVEPPEPTVNSQPAQPKDDVQAKAVLQGRTKFQALHA